MQKNYKSQEYHVYMPEKFNIIVEKGEDGYFIAEVIELPGCRTQAKSYDDLFSRMKESISLYLEENKNTERVEFLGVQQIEV